MKKNIDLCKLSMRYGALYVPNAFISKEHRNLNQTTLQLIEEMYKMGFICSESLLQAVNVLPPALQYEILDGLRNITGIKKNWTPLIKNWTEIFQSNKKTSVGKMFSKWFNSKNIKTLSCGDQVPKDIFPLDQYNGCPLCGKPMNFQDIEFIGQNKSGKILDLWSDENLEHALNTLLSSKTALDATQVDSLKLLLKYFELPTDVDISMKETKMLVIRVLIEYGFGERVGNLFKSPQDILRYLWYKQTGHLQIIEPKTMIIRAEKQSEYRYGLANRSMQEALKVKVQLKLKYTRTECRLVASWLNNLQISPEIMCEMMHPKRNMWVRFIRALRLAEYSKKQGFEHLAEVLDVFYNKSYTVWQGRVNHYRLRYNADKTFSLLKQRPGLFARSLFSNMLWFGPELTISHFKEITDKIPVRLLLTLNMYAQNYFGKDVSRLVKSLGGAVKHISGNRLLELYSEEQLFAMRVMIENLCLEAIKYNFSKQDTDSKTIYIDDRIRHIPLSIGDRSETVQELPSALMGTRYPVQGDSIRLFMQWGEGLPPQHLDMDLSCNVIYEDRSTFCSYSRLRIAGCQHSGDIQYIPNKCGTAEYIEVNVNELRKNKAKYVVFTCNAYTKGRLTPNMVVGWMNSKYPMKVSASGVAYDPSNVQHQIKITNGLSKGLVFGVLDVKSDEIIWLEMSFEGQVVQNLNLKTVESLLRKLEAKLTIGDLLEIKANAQNLVPVNYPEEGDEVYDVNWAKNTAQVTQLFVD